MQTSDSAGMPFHTPIEDDKPREECGIVGIWGHADAAALIALGLHALQHRGQEAAGIVSLYDGQFHTHRALGEVGETFSDPAVMDRLPGDTAIGHNRYSTSGDTLLRNVQPLFADFESGGFAIGHNGNLTNARKIRRELVHRGSLFQSTTDTEVIIHLIATASDGSVLDRLVEALRQVTGAYSLIALTDKEMIGLRDPYGVRPLVIGMLDEAYILASETCALDIVGARFIRDVAPGEIVVIGCDGMRTFSPFSKRPKRFCVFEYIYFARPDSTVDSINVYEARRRIGAELAREQPADADVVIPIPDSGVPAALGYAREARLAYEVGIIRNHYVGRTFIEPSDRIRHLGVRLKHNANRSVIDGCRVILVDDSIVRGTTSTKIVEMVRNAGATEVHMRIASPPTTHSCYYGVDTPERDELLAARHNVEEMMRLIGVDSLAYLSLDGLYRALGETRRDPDAPQFCDACFSGDYPISLTDRDGGEQNGQLSLLTQVP